MGRATYTLEAESDEVTEDFQSDDIEEHGLLSEEIAGNEEAIQELLGEP